MLKIFCDFCSNEIEGGDGRFLKIINRNIEGKDLQIRIEAKAKEGSHICNACAKKQIKAVLPK